MLDTTPRTPRGSPFSRTLLQLVPEMVHRTFETTDLELDLRKHMDSKLEPSESFDQIVPDVGFNEQQLEIANRLAKGKKLEPLVRGRGRDRKTILSAAYILLEAQLLLPPL